MSTITLTDAERDHLLTLLAEAESEGTYYGNREQYRKREQRLREKLCVGGRHQA